MQLLKILLFLLILQSCYLSKRSDLNFVNDSTCSNKSLFFPIEFSVERGDSIILYNQTAYLKAINENKIYGCRQNSDIIRLTYWRAFNEDVMIRVTPDSVIVKYDVEAVADLSVYNMTKLSQKEAELFELKDQYDFLIRIAETKEADSLGRLYPKIFDSSYFESLHRKIYEPNFVQHHLQMQKFKIRNSEFKKLLETINHSDFWSMNNFINAFAGLDGSSFFLEVSSEKRYKFVYAWEPEGELKDVCRLFLKYTDIKEADIY
jgi:hypothetical protein